MIDNQPLSNDAPLDTPAPTQTDISTTNSSENNALDYSKLTPQNWLFINGFLSSGNVKKAYELAKYEGRNESAPYQVFKRLKPYIEQLGDLDVTSRARLQADLKQVLDLPLDEQKKSLTLSEWLRVRKFVASITPEATTQKPNISVLVINRPAKREMDTPKTITPQSDFDGKEVIDVTPITEPEV